MATQVGNTEARREAVVGDAPRRAAGLELLGLYEDSGFKEPPYLARRADGQVVQLSQLLYLVAEAADGRRDDEQIGEHVSAQIGRRLTADNVRFLIARKLRPLGVMAAPDGSTPELEKRDAVLALRRRRPLVPERVVQPIAAAFGPLFRLPVVILALVALAALDGWLFFSHGVAGALHSAIYNPPLLLAIFGSVILATAFHEVGHAAACRFGGARPGAIGAGLYLIWPAFYCDVTDAYRLPRKGRLRTDLGGVYFNGIFALAAGAAYFATNFEPLLLVVVLQHFAVAQQLLPLLRFDGYYVLTDLTGVPDIISRVGAIFRSLIPWREPEPRVQELKPWVRFVTTGYVALVVPLVLGLVGWVVLGAPRLFATIFDSLSLHADRAAAAAREGDWSAALLDGLEGSALLLPALAMGLTLFRLAKLLVTSVRRWAAGSRGRQAVAFAGGVAAAAFLVAGLWPDGDYRPIRPGERGTIPEVYAHPLHVTSGSTTTSTTLGVTGSDTGGSAPARRSGEQGPVVTQRDRREQTGETEERTPDPAAETAEPSPSTAPAGASSPAATPSPTVSAEPTATAEPLAQPGEGDPVNEARALNDTDHSRLFELAFDIQRIRGTDRLEHTNIAQAVASCEACRTIAIAVQVVIVMATDVDYAVPINYAESLNVACTGGCETLAYAWQLILMTAGEVEFTQDALRKIADIERRLAELENSDLPVTDIEAAADELMDELRDTVMNGLQPVEQQESTATTTPEPTSTGPAEPTPTRTPAATATPDETATEQATPTPEPTPEQTTTTEPTPEPTPSATPEGTGTAGGDSTTGP